MFSGQTGDLGGAHMKLGVVVMLLVLAAAVVLVLRRPRQPADQDKAPVGVVMKEAAEDAVSVAAARHQIELDYSPESVRQVEKILAAIYDDLDGGPINLDLEKDEAWRWGAYIGEVILRSQPPGGRWEVDHHAGGPNSFPVRVERGDSFPIVWCRKRLRNGPEDNVWTKYQALYLVPDDAAIVDVSPDG